MFKKFSALFTIVFLLVFMHNIAGAQQAPDVTTIIVIRHAEKENAGSDPDLSAAGKARSAKLAAFLKDVPLTKLLSTPYKRTHQTLEPLSAASGLTIDSYDPEHLTSLAKTLKETKGQTIVIAGHSNTAPQLVNLLLNNKKYNQLGEDDFSKIWLVTLKSGDVVSCLLLNSL